MKLYPVTLATGVVQLVECRNEAHAVALQRLENAERTLFEVGYNVEKLKLQLKFEQMRETLAKQEWDEAAVSLSKLS